MNYTGFVRPLAMLPCMVIACQTVLADSSKETIVTTARFNSGSSELTLETLADLRTLRVEKTKICSTQPGAMIISIEAYTSGKNPGELTMANKRVANIRENLVGLGFFAQMNFSQISYIASSNKRKEKLGQAPVALHEDRVLIEMVCTRI